MVFNLNHVIDQVVKDKGINRDMLVEALESAVLSAANKNTVTPAILRPISITRVVRLSYLNSLQLSMKSKTLIRR